MDFSLAVIIVAGLGADYLFRKLKLPGILGMLLVGILTGPQVFHLLKPPMLEVSADFRKLALIVILLRAGFELRREAVNRGARPALLMATIPVLFETAGVILAAHAWLHLEWLPAAILGIILAAVSPAMVVPAMIDFIERGKGKKKNIPTMVLASASINNVLVIVIFTILAGFYGGRQINLAWQLAGIPVSIILGILLGLVPGFLLHQLFLKFDLSSTQRTLLILGVALILNQAEDLLKNIVPIASLLGVMAIGFIILEKEEAVARIISQNLKRIWVFAEMLLFVLIGAQVNIKVTLDAGLVGLAVIAGGLLCRSLGTYLAVSGAGLKVREKAFCVVSNLPKATVQAAVGAIPLELGVPGGALILAVSVLAIIVTTPLGAVAIEQVGERVLDEDDQEVYRFKHLRERLHLPHVGQWVRSKKYGTAWKIIEEKEVWVEDVAVGAARGPSIPGINLRFWHPRKDELIGAGKTMQQTYVNNGGAFYQHWEVIPDK